MQSIKTRLITHTILFFLVYAMMLYIVVRALNMVITHDEAYSFYNVKHFWWVETLCTGNTHWFNFIAIKTAVILGLEKANQLRWFSLLSSGIFLTVAYLWIKSLKDIPVKMFAFSVLLLNPFLIDYLSLARGYATGLMFEVLCILYCFLALKRPNSHKATFALFFAGMSAIANFNFFYFFAAYSIIHFLKHHFKQDFSFLKNKWFYVESIFALGITCLVVKALQFITVCSNDIGAFGGSTLVESVFSEFVYTLIYRDTTLDYRMIQFLAYAIFISLLCMSVYGIWKSRQHRNFWYTMASQLFVLILLLCVFNKWCLDVLYPTGRTALMLYPLMALVATGFFKSIYQRSKIKRVILYAISALLLVNFLSNMSMTRTFDYWQQTDTKTCFTYLDSVGAKKVGIAPELYSVYRNYYQVTDKYQFHFDGKSINTAFPKGVDESKNQLKEFDYLLLFPPYNLSFYRNNAVKLVNATYYPESRTLLVKVE